MTDKKVYVVTADTLNNPWGAKITLFLITDDLSVAKATADKLSEDNYVPKITETLLNTELTFYLGGHEE